MNKVNFMGTCLLLAAATLAGCKDDDAPGAITVENKQSLTQDVYADDTSGKSGVSFTTAGAWTSSITGVAATKAEGPAWVSIAPDHGDEAGAYTIAITLEPNYAGADRAATIHIICGDTEITINVAQKGVKEDGEVYLPSFSELLALREEFGGQLGEAWLQVDNGYATLAARQSLAAENPVVLDFWEKAYKQVLYDNLLLELLGAQGDLSEMDKNAYRSDALASRATAYFYLKTLFGGVPLVTDPGTPVNTVPSATAQEVVDQVYDDIDMAADLSGSFVPIAVDNVHFGLLREIIFVQEADGFNHVIDALTRKISSGELAFQDTNKDGTVNGQDDNGAATRAYLLLAEAYLNVGNAIEAAARINQVNAIYSRPLVNPASGEILAAIDAIYSTLTNTGMKFMNAVRRGETNNWEHRALLPIPALAMQENPNLRQNPGW